MREASTSAPVLGSRRAEVGESPLWDAETGSLLWVDLLAGQLIRSRPDGRASTIAELQEPLGFVVAGSDGGLVAGTQSGIGRLELADGRFELITPIEPERRTFRINDGACDRQGRLWFGTMSDHDTEADGRLYRLDPGWRIGHVRTGMQIPNGLAWNAAGTIMCLADSRAGTIEILDYDIASGVPRQLRALVRLTPEQGQPDGMAIDAEDCIWFATWSGGSLLRYDLTGALLDEVHLGLPLVSSCAFGGQQLETLFITSAHYGLSDAQRREAPTAGALMRATPTIPGAEVDAYRVQ